MIHSSGDASVFPGLVRVELERLTVPEDHLRRWKLSKRVMETLYIFKAERRGTTHHDSSARPRGKNKQLDSAALSSPSVLSLSEGGQQHQLRHIEQTLVPLLLCAYAKSDQSQPATELLQLKADANMGDYDGRRPLHIAAAEGNDGFLATLLQHCPDLDVNCEDLMGNTALAECLNYLGEDGGPIVPEGGTGHRAISEDDGGKAITSVTCSPDDRTRSTTIKPSPTPGKAPFEWSKKLVGRLRCAALLAERGGKLGLRAEERASRMCWLVAEDRLFELECWLKFGAASTSLDGDTAHEKVLVVDSLADYDRRSPMHVASSLRNRPAQKLLLHYGAVENNLLDRWGNSVFEENPKLDGDDSKASVGGAHLLVRPGLGGGGKNKQQLSAPLLFSALEELLAQVDADSSPESNTKNENPRDERAVTVARALVPSLVCALAACGDTEILTQALVLIRRFGICVEDLADYDDRTPLHIAASTDSKAVVQTLLWHGCDPLRRDRFGATAVLEAIRNKSSAGLLGMLLAEIGSREKVDTTLHTGGAVLVGTTTSRGGGGTKTISEGDIKPTCDVDISTAKESSRTTVRDGLPTQTERAMGSSGAHRPLGLRRPQLVSLACWAAFHSDFRLLEGLISCCGADVLSRLEDYDGRTCFSIARDTGHQRLVEWLEGRLRERV